MKTKYLFLTAVALNVLGLSAGRCLADASAARPTTEPATAVDANQDLRAEINELRAEVAELKSGQNQSQAENSAALAAMTKDADQHSQLLSATTGISPVTAGWNSSSKQFFMGSEDGDFYLHPGIIFQFRQADNDRQRPSTWQNGFEVRRAKFYFDGNLLSPDLTYKFQWQDVTNGGGPVLEYAWGQYVALHDVGPGDVAVRAGQFKDPVYKEETYFGDPSQLLTDRSVENTLVGGNGINGPFVQGIDLMYTGKNSPLHADLVFHDGDASSTAINSDFNNVVTGGHTNFGGAVRGDLKLFGDWADSTDATGKNSGKHNFLDMGGGVDWSQEPTSAPNPVGTSASQVVRAEVDGQLLIAKVFSFYAQGNYDYIAAKGVTTGPTNLADWGAMAEAGVFITPAWQIVGRYSFSEIDHRFKVSGQDEFPEIAVGLNYFLGDNGDFGNHAKITVDFTYLPNGVPPTPSTAGLDLLSSTHGEYLARTQFQIWF
jgi:hypothetical protein